MLLLADDRLQNRRRAAAGPLASLADSLAADLEPLLQREVYLPRSKALLSRAGGRCDVDGSLLEFDPFSPHAHRCPSCQRVYHGDLHHRWWVYSYQLWLAERAVQASLLYLLRGDARHATLARTIALRYAESYDTYPNVDNVLGPSRLFFSSYLESIWLLQLCIAADLLDATGDRETADVVRHRIVRPSAALVRQYDEGLSNRQVWNNAALMASALVLGDRAGAERVVAAPSGVAAHLQHGLLSDGSWYEGENYHLFAHRGLWYAVVMAEVAGIAIEPSLLDRFQDGFAAPFGTALPDFTLPSRKDSQYAISLQQVRFAELCELGLSRHDNPRLAGVLDRIYASDAPRRDTGRARSTADVERNEPPSQLTRADLGWRSLLHANEEQPSRDRLAPASAHLAAQGIAVFRRDKGEAYVALDYGQSGGGHGHPDRLNLLFAHGHARWLDDLGTGSYVDPTLRWFRSTLAHNAPMIDGRSQFRADGELCAYEERGAVGWVLAEVQGLAPGVHVERALIVTPDYFVDELRWTAASPIRFELPIHFDGAFSSNGVALTATEALDGGDGAEDGFTFSHDVTTARVVAAAGVELSSHDRGGRSAHGWVSSDSETQWFRAFGPGQPAGTTRPFFVARWRGQRGVVSSVWSWSPRVAKARFDDGRIEVFLDASTPTRGEPSGAQRHVHRRRKRSWHMETIVGDARSSIELAGWRARAQSSPQDSSPHNVSPHDSSPPDPSDRVRPAARSPVVISGTSPAVFDLGEAHYRRSEQTWAEAGRPTARISVSASGRDLIVDARVGAGTPVFVRRDAVNPYDNEHPDINGHGMQLYVTTPVNGGAWTITPEADSGSARVRSLAGWGAMEIHGAQWEPLADGYRLRVRVALPHPTDTTPCPLALDVIINEMPHGRERRRGQLVLSGSQGEFVYLRGDRHDQTRLVPMIVVE